MIFDMDEKIKSGTSGEWIVDVVCVGDNVAIIPKVEHMSNLSYY
jgi:hypothetical protein